LAELDSGWIKSGISGLYHYISHVTLDEMRTAPCGYKTRKFAGIKNKSEISDVLLICPKCELIIKNHYENNKKKRSAAEFTDFLKSTETHKLIAVICSEKGCNEAGAAFVSTTGKPKPHHCILHNIRIPLEDRKKYRKKLNVAA
jgi:hypothetical protein